MTGSPPRAWGQLPVCGRHFAHRGSPPRAWGQLSKGKKNEASNRFTPTGVGTTKHGAVHAALAAVHPHGRGDNWDQLATFGSYCGSPPRAWGQRRYRLPERSFDRFTPTGVGTTWALALSCTRLSVHPHGRGDNWWPAALSLPSCGLSPRAWGQRLFLLHRFL